jgi:hypothetical protein
MVTSFQGYTDSKFGQGTGNIYLDNVICKGNEAAFGSCVHSQWGTHKCDHTSEAGVHCYNTTGEY